MKKAMFYGALTLCGLLACNRLASMDLDFDLDVVVEYSEIEIALENNDTEKIESILDMYEKYPEKLEKDSFIAAIQYNNVQAFDRLLCCIEKRMNETHPVSFTIKAIDIFCEIVKRMMVIMDNNQIEEIYFSTNENIIYIFLEKFFERIIQKIGYNPYTLASGDGHTPALRLLCMYHTIYDEETGENKGKKPNQFLNNLIKYFIEMGVPIYANKYAGIVYGSAIVQPRPLFWYAKGNPEMQEYFKLIGRYNKQLLNVNEQITKLEVLEKFITKLKLEEQEDIFKVAATRGHVKVLTMLEKLNDKKYSMDEALKLARKRNVWNVISLFKKQKSLGDDVFKALQEIEYVDQNNEKKKLISNNTELGVIVFGIKDMLTRAHPKKFKALVEGFRKD